MNHFKMTLEYDGSRYSGWQRLGKNESSNTIERKLLDVLKKMTGEEPELFCGSRTEAGVHAYGQVVSFSLNTDASAEEIKRYLNRYLPMDIAILELASAPERFHAALTAASRTYLYRIAVGDVPSVFDRKYTYYSFQRPDPARMQEAAALLKGRHDFAAFSSAKKNKSTVKELTALDICKDDREIRITMTANDFLHNMARMIASTLLEIGLDRRPASDIPKIFDPASDVTASLPAEPCGLFLDHIDYKTI